MDSSFSDLSQDSELMKGLKEMGLVLDDGESEKKKKKPPPQAAPKAKIAPKDSSSDLDIDNFLNEIASPRERGSAPRPSAAKNPPKPKRKKSASRRPGQMRPIRLDDIEIEPAKSRLTFDYLLDDPLPQPQPQAPQPLPQIQTQIVHVPPPVELMMEARITDYLNYAMQAMTNDVLSELEEMLRDERDADAIVNEFLRDLQKQIRESVSFETDSPEYAKRTLNSFENFAPGFIEAITKIRRLQGNSMVANLNSIRASRASITSRLSLLQDSFAANIDTLSQEISEAQGIRSQVLTARAMTDRQATMVMHRYSDIEAKEIMQRTEREILETNRVRFQFNAMEEKHDIPMPQINRRLKDLARALRETALAEPNPAQLVKRTKLHILDLTDQLSSMRRAYSYQHQQLCDIYSVLLAPPRVPVREWARETSIQEFPTENPKTTTELSVSSVHSRLAQIRKEQDDCLKDVSSFIDKTMHSKPRHARRKRHHL